MKWANWNYSGWQAKEAFPSLKALSDSIAGDFNDPRVIFEHTTNSAAAGTPRVFEMIRISLAGQSLTVCTCSQPS